MDLVELHRWLSALGEPSLGDFASAFEMRVRTQTAVERRWIRRRRGADAEGDLAAPALKRRS